MMFGFLHDDIAANYASKRQKQIAQMYRNVLGGPHGVALQASALAGVDIAAREWRRGGMNALHKVVDDQMKAHEQWLNANKVGRKSFLAEPVSAIKLANHGAMVSEMYRMYMVFERYDRRHGTPTVPTTTPQARHDKLREPTPS